MRITGGNVGPPLAAEGWTREKIAGELGGAWRACIGCSGLSGASAAAPRMLGNYPLLNS
jgi:hypothetical protein